MSEYYRWQKPSLLLTFQRPKPFLRHWDVDDDGNAAYLALECVSDTFQVVSRDSQLFTILHKSHGCSALCRAIHNRSRPCKQSVCNDCFILLSPNSAWLLSAARSSSNFYSCASSKVFLAWSTAVSLARLADGMRHRSHKTSSVLSGKETDDMDSVGSAGMASVCHALASGHVSTSSMPCHRVHIYASFWSDLPISMTFPCGEQWRGCEIRASVWLRPVEASRLKEAITPILARRLQLLCIVRGIKVRISH